MLGTITKKELCHYLGLVHPGGKLDYRALKQQYFTQKVLNELNISEDDYQRKRKFTPDQSYHIIRIFNLEGLLRRMTIRK